MARYTSATVVDAATVPEIVRVAVSNVSPGGKPSKLCVSAVVLVKAGSV